MARDTRDLLESMELVGFGYREIAAEEERSAAAHRWPLLAELEARLADGWAVGEEDEGEAIVADDTREVCA